MNAADLEREHDEPHAGSHAPFVLDRQRIVHSSAFRRLEYKTQAFLSLEGDHYRTRLTHTLEVAHLARLIAERLGLNAELAEAAALAHDLGHPPFGHAGERALAACMEARGGFEHNVHSLRVVEYLEHPYPSFRGLNLTRIVRECLAKHSTQFDKPGRHPLQDGLCAPLEGQVADVADRLAYALHDLQDGLYAGLIEPAALQRLKLWHEAYDGPAADQPRSIDESAATGGGSWRGHVRPAMDRMQDTLVDDVVQATLSHLDTAGVQVADETQRGEDARRAGEHLVRLSAEADTRLQELEDFLLANVYRHQRLVRMDSKARRIVNEIFDAYVAEPALMPARYASRVKEQTVYRVAADYIAGMTDRFCLNEHARLFDPRFNV